MAQKQKNSLSSEPLHDQLRLALNSFDDPTWLGAESPLAAPYFLGDALQAVADGETAVGRGQALQKILKQAANTLWPHERLPRTRDELEEIVAEERREQGNKGSGYIYLLLDVRYFRSYFRSLDYPKAGHEQDIIEYLGVGRSPYFRHLKTAREALADALLTQLHPTYRLERPFLPQTDLLGRDQLIQTVTNKLRAGETVSLTGMGGMGKTAVAATKTYTSQLLAIAMLSAAWSQAAERFAAIEKLGEWGTAVLAHDEAISQMAQRYRYMQQCVVLGRGYNYATAFEWSLKLKELTYVVAEPYSSADFRHGPIAIVDRGFPVMAIAPTGAVLADMHDLLQKLASEKQAELLIISNDAPTLALAHSPIPLPTDLPEWLSPLVSILPAQLFAYHLTGVKGYNTEAPRGLNKVTKTT